MTRLLLLLLLLAALATSAHDLPPARHPENYSLRLELESAISKAAAHLEQTLLPTATTHPPDAPIPESLFQLLLLLQSSSRLAAAHPDWVAKLHPLRDHLLRQQHAAGDLSQNPAAAPLEAPPALTAPLRSLQLRRQQYLLTQTLSRSPHTAHSNWPRPIALDLVTTQNSDGSWDTPGEARHLQTLLALRTAELLLQEL